MRSLSFAALSFPPLLLLLSGQVRSDASILFTANLNNASENPPIMPDDERRPGPARIVRHRRLRDRHIALTMSFTATIFNIDVTGQQTPTIPTTISSTRTSMPAPTVTPTTNGPSSGGSSAALQRQQPR